MTISYAAEVPNGSSFGCFWRILLKWRGSVYKLIWRELLAYLSVYYTINLIYRYGLNEDQKRIFEKIRQYFGAQSESIPMSFVLGFYVSLIVKRWWEQYRMLPWPDTLALFISAGIPGNHETGRLMRRNIMRYAVLSYVITLQRISLRVKRRFPSWQHIVDAGLMLESEKKIFEIMDGKSPMSKYWMPLVWATNIINRARKDGLITSDHIVQTLLMELSDIRRRLGGLIGYDTVCVPLVYTQVVTLVLYTYFIAALMGRQMVPIVDQTTRSTKYEEPDLYFPLFTALQFCFYVGWLKVAEVLINPFGEDDDDFELNWLIDRHIKASYMIVDEMHEEHPELLKDQYWEEVVPKDLPYTVASEHYRRSEPKGSAELYKIKQADAVYANIIPKRMINEDVYADYESVDTPIIERRKNWFSRQITRMGSVRSSSTAYSSGGLFARNRHNSVYSSPEAGMLPNHIPTSTAHKMSFYDKFVNRKSVRAQRQLMKQNSKLSLNGGVMTTAPPRNRPRIPTPDVTKESMDREHNRFAITTINSLPSTIGPLANTNGIATPSIASGVALMTHQLANTPNMYQSSMNSNDLPVVGTLLLSPIKEMDSNSVNNTLQIGHPATAALAKAVLPHNLQTAQFDFNGFTNTSLSDRSLGSVIPTITHSSPAPTNTVPALSMVLPSSSPNESNIPTSLSHDMFPLSVSSLPIVVPITSHSNVIITELPADSSTSTTTTTSASDNISINEPEFTSINKSASLRSSKRDRPLRKVNNHIKSASTSNEMPIERKSSLDLKPLDSLHPPAIGKYKEVASAPSTLTKSKPETKTGEVYV